MTESKLRYAATLPLAAASLIASALLAERANAQSNPYALDRLFLAQGQSQPFDSVLSFNSVTAVENYYGVSTEEATLAQDFFAGYTGTSANMLFTRLPVLSARAHLVGGNVSNLSLAQLQAINGTISVTSQGYNYSASINLSGVTGTGTTAFKNAAYIIQTDLNNSLPPAAAATGSITPVSVAFTGSVNNLLLTVSSAPPGSIQVGSIITGRGMPAGAQITSQVSGTPNGAGVYSLYVPEGHISTGTLTETYGKLTVGSVSPTSPGPVKIGQQVTGTGSSVLPLTAIEAQLSSNTWLVNYAQTVTSENMTMTGAPLSVVYTPVTGATENRGSFSIQQNGDFLYNSSSVSYATGSAASLLYLAESTGPPGQQASLNPGEIAAPNGCPAGASECVSIATFMNNLLAENPMFSTFQTTWDPPNYIPPGEKTALEAWVSNEDAEGGQYTYLENYSDTTPPIVASEDPSAKQLFATAGATVPEPSTWAMALLGFAGLGLMARYRPGRSTCPSGRRIASTGRPSGDAGISP
jgi:hypothetical protein